MFRLILASSSPSRLSLLKDINIIPDEIISPDIDEEPLKNELPRSYCIRVAENKFNAVAATIKGENNIIIAADTVSVCGRKMLHKPDNNEQVREHLKVLSGRRHRVYTATFCGLVNHGKIIKVLHRIVTTIVQFKRLTDREIDYVVASGQGIGKCGGCQIAKLGGRYVKFVGGSFSNVIGLPQYEVTQMIYALGYDLNKR